MTAFWKRATATTALVLAAGLGLAACGPSGGDSAPAAEQSEAPQSSVMTAEDFAGRISEAQLEAGSAHLQQTMSVQGQEMAMDADIVLSQDPSKLAMSMTTVIPGGGGDMEMRLVDGVIYMSMGEMTQGKFIQLDGDESGLGDLSSMLDQADPQAQMEVFAAALQDFSAEEGAETIDGVETVKYTLVLDTAKVMEGQELPEVPEGTLEETIEYEMFVGPDDLPRRLVMTVAGSDIVQNYSKWGEDVSVEAPAADQITDGAQFGL